MFCIYALLAIPFRSFSQPLIIMAAIPFGLVGAVAGHLLMGMNISVLSLFGMVGLTGVVVNDSLVLVHAANRIRDDGADSMEAVVQAGGLRFRAIILTSLTTFAGLTPMLLEKSLQAQFLIPMVHQPRVRSPLRHGHNTVAHPMRVFDPRRHPGYLCKTH